MASVIGPWAPVPEDDAAWRELPRRERRQHVSLLLPLSSRRPGALARVAEELAQREIRSPACCSTDGSGAALHVGRMKARVGALHDHCCAASRGARSLAADARRLRRGVAELGWA